MVDKGCVLARGLSGVLLRVRNLFGGSSSDQRPCANRTDVDRWDHAAGVGSAVGIDGPVFYPRHGSTGSRRTDA